MTGALPEIRMGVALLLIDIQNDYFPGGKMARYGSEQAAQVAYRLRAFFREHRLPVVHVQHLSIRPGVAFFLPATPGAQIHSLVKPGKDEALIQKHFPNAFRGTGLLSHLERLGTRKLVIAGMMTHMCVDATVQAATDNGFECRIVQDACATQDLKFGERLILAADVHAAFLAALNGTYGRVLTADAVLAELQSELPG
jgi:nicotinamidase-related amidase